jgi:hypothetical protein
MSEKAVQSWAAFFLAFLGFCCHCERSEAISTLEAGDCFGANSAPTQKLVHRHCERSEAISDSRLGDCFVGKNRLLAMTRAEQ